MSEIDPCATSMLATPLRSYPRNRWARSCTLLATAGIILIAAWLPALAQESTPPAMPTLLPPSLSPDHQKELLSRLPALPEGTESATFLLEQQDGQAVERWILRLAPKMADPRENEPTEEPLRYFTTTGRVVEFPRERANLDVTTLGPFANDSFPAAPGTASLTPQHTLISVYQSSLALGFDQTCRAVLRLGEAANSADLTPAQRQFGAQNVPFPEAVTNEGRALAEIVGLTEAEEHAIVGSGPALIEFFRIAMETQVTRELLRETIDLPVMSILLSGGRFPEVGFQPMKEVTSLDPGPWQMPAGTPVYSLAYVLFLNQRPALHFRLAVAPPRGALLSSAGIIGLAAMAPDGRGPRLFAKILVEPPPRTSLEGENGNP